jgi:hypothetical protein
MATLSQGPQPQFRNLLADAIRDYTPTLANRLNDPTSGAGLAVDAVGGLADMLIGHPYRSMSNLLSRPYVSGDPQAAEDAFNVAGAAMVGGLAAPRPRNSLGASGRPSAEKVTLYHGTSPEAAGSILGARRVDGPAFFSPSRQTAQQFGEEVVSVPVDKSQLLVDFDLPGARLLDVETANAYRDKPGWTIDDWLASGQSVGVNADVLFANGGRPGALAGASINALADNQPTGIRAYHGSPRPDWTRNLRPGDI